MPNPLSDSERLRIIKEAKALGVPDERVLQDLAALEGYGPAAPGGAASKPLVEFGPGGQEYVAGTGQVPEGYTLSDILYGRATPQQMAGFAARQFLIPAGAAIGGVAGRAAGSAIPALAGRGFLPAAGRVAASSLGEGAGVFAGALGTQAAEQAPLDYQSAALAAGLQAGLSAGGSALTYGAARASGMPPSGPAGAAMGRPGFAARLPQTAEMDLAREANLAAKNMARSAGRVRLDEMVAAHDQTGTRFIDNNRLLQAMEMAMPTGQSREAIAARRMLRQDIRRVRAEMAQVASANKYSDPGVYFPYKAPTVRPGTEGMRYPMTAAETDALIQRNLTSAVKKELEGKVGGVLYKDVRAEARNRAAQELYRSLGPGASEAGEEAHQALLARESMLKTFPADKTGRPLPVAAARIAQAGSTSGVTAPVLMARAEGFDAASGSRIADKIRELGFKRVWQPSDEQSAAIIADTLNIPRGRTGISGIRSSIRAMARVGVRAQGVTGAAARGYASRLFEGAMRPNP